MRFDREAQAQGPERTGPFGGLQLEIVASLFVVMLAGLALVAVVMTALSIRVVRTAALERLEVTAIHLERLARREALRLSDLAALVQTREARQFGQWWVVDASESAVLPNPEPLPDALRELARRGWAAGGVQVEEGDLFGALALTRRIQTRSGAAALLVGTVSAEQLTGRFWPLLASIAWMLVMAAGVFVGFGSYLLRRRIVSPVRKLSDAMRAMAGGDLTVRARAEGAREIAGLACGFNEMARSLARERAALARTHESLLRSQRLAALGQLAAGVAHEVGNPVAAVLGYGELLLRDPALAPRSREAAERVQREALRVRTLVRELLDLSRSQSAGMAGHPAQALLERAVELLRPQPLLEGVELVLVPPAQPLPEVWTDGRRVEQILVNLVENAAHALRGCPGARVEVEARPAELRALPGRRKGDPPGAPIGGAARPAVSLSVLDNGPGVDPELLPQIFDPFFTTKDPGEGTGLGLWNAHRLAEMLGGRLEVESAPGRTRFSLILPLADTQDADGEATGSDHR